MSEACFFTDGWEAKLDLKPYTGVPIAGLPPDWRMAIKVETFMRGGITLETSSRKYFVSPEGKPIRNKSEVDLILGFTLGETDTSVPGWEEKLGLKPCSAELPAGLPPGWKLAIKPCNWRADGPEGFRCPTRTVYVSPVGEILHGKSEVKRKLGVELGTVTREKKPETRFARSSSSSQHPMDQDTVPAPATAIDLKV